MAARKICGKPSCPHLQPCPDHPPRKAWEDSDRASRTQLSGSAQQARRARILFLYDGICHVCGRPGADQVDHVIPLAEGGPDTDENCRPIHERPCHQAKTSEEAKRARSRA